MKWAVALSLSLSKELSGGSSEMGINLGSTIIDKKERIDERGKERGN